MASGGLAQHGFGFLERPYKPAFDHAKSLDIIIGGDGRTSPAHFDPAVLNSFKTVAARFREIWDQHANA